MLVCGGCGRRMVADRRRHKGPASDKFHNYYRCPTRQHKGKDACVNSKNYRAKEAEGQVWEFVSELLKDSGRLRAGLEQLTEEERSASHSDPERQEKAWLGKLATLDRKRSGFQDMAAEGLIAFDELREKLDSLEETWKTVQKELQAVRRRRERIEMLERDAETLLGSYATMVPKALDALSPEQRHHVYKMLRLRVLAHPDGSLEPSGVLVCRNNMTSRSNRSLPIGAARL